jgi:ribosomal protein S18 acetylase RimI-like enzyme
VWCVVRGAFDRSGYVRAIVVDARWRGHGLGRALLDHAETFLAQQAGDVFLLVSDFNQDAQRFYQRHGYTQVGALPDYVVPGVTELIFHKRLES